MISRDNRHRAIRGILETSKISSQNELRERLEDLGFETTQATLSRDLAALRVVRIPDTDKGYIYALSSQTASSFSLMEGNSPLNACKSITFSHNLAVLKCLPSFAPSVALFLDALEMDVIIGTIAGDDTILIIIREGVTHEQFRAALVSRLPELRDRI